MTNFLHLKLVALIEKYYFVQEIINNLFTEL